MAGRFHIQHHYREETTYIQPDCTRVYYVCVQETQWLAVEAALWPHGLLLRNCFYSTAVAGCEGQPSNGDEPKATEGRCGGVATFLPAGYRFIQDECQVLVPGYAILTAIRTPLNDKIRVVNLYLRPGSQDRIWQNMIQMLPQSAALDPNLIIIGDFNTDLSPNGVGPSPLLWQINANWAVLYPPSPTWRGRTEPRTLDGAALPLRSLADWSVTGTWTSLSDHAMLTFRRGKGPAPDTHACSPGKYWQLPEEARADLRRVWGFNAAALGVPETEGVTNLLPQTRPQQPGDTDAKDPIWGLLEAQPVQEEQEATTSRGAEANGEFRPMLAKWGYAFTQASFTTWWRKWRRKRPKQAPERMELARIAHSLDANAQTPSPLLGMWLTSVGGLEHLTPAEAQDWLGVWISLSNAATAAKRFSSGATTARPNTRRQTVAGRAIHKPFYSHNHVILPDGTTLDQEEATGAALVDTRAHIWFSKDPCQPQDSSLLDGYVHTRKHGLSEHLSIGYSFLRACIMSMAGSAPGVDGAPYEVYHLHPQLFAVLLWQAFSLLPKVAASDPWGMAGKILDTILGPSIDLLLWIPKVIGDHRVGQQRPLQLPTTLRRLFGCACTRLLSPVIEPLLTDSQAAKAGGTCQRNIAAAHRHLACEEDPARPPYRIPHSSWVCKEVFQEAASPVLRVCERRQRAAHPSIRRSPACFLLDQAKAFEMLSHAWLRLVLKKWGFPR